LKDAAAKWAAVEVNAQQDRLAVVTDVSDVLAVEGG